MSKMHLYLEFGKPNRCIQAFITIQSKMDDTHSGSHSQYCVSRIAIHLSHISWSIIVRVCVRHHLSRCTKNNNQMHDINEWNDRNTRRIWNTINCTCFGSYFLFGLWWHKSKHTWDITWNAVNMFYMKSAARVETSPSSNETFYIYFPMWLST